MSVEIRRTQRHPMDWALDHMGMTRTELEAETGLSKSYLLRLSQGRHSQMSETVVQTLYRLAREKGFDIDTEILGRFGPAIDLESAYDAWVIRHRQEQTIPDPVKDTKINPFMRLVKAAGGVARMSALLAAPDQLVERYAKGVTYRMPVPIMMAFTDMDYPHLNHLDQSMQKWGEKHG